MHHMEPDILADWNPWWVSREVPDPLHRLDRDIVGLIMPMMGQEEILTIVGVRRSGKSTILYQVVRRLLAQGAPPENVMLVNMEDPRMAGASVGDVLATYRQMKNPRGRSYILLDEVQSSAGWERWVLLDHERRKDVKFIVTGSSSALVRGELARLLTGRTRTVRILPLSFREFLAFRGARLDVLSGSELRDVAINQVGRYLEAGGFPKAVLDDDANRAQTLRDYFDTILYRDVVHNHGADPEKLETLATYVLDNAGTEQSFRALEQATRVSVVTVKEYLRHLGEAFMLIDVWPLTFKTKPVTVERLPHKYYCIDTGLRNTVSSRRSSDLGRLAEGAVCLELVRRGERPRYWRNDGEVDFVCGHRPGRLAPVNVCYTDDVPEREARSLGSFRSHVPPPFEEPLMLTRSTEGSEDGVRRQPLWRWLLAGAPGVEPFRGG
jgi:predicted AAA+ superfamily ATPase